MVKLTNKNFEDTVINSKKLMIVDFWAEWCGPCRMVEPILNELSNELDNEKVIIGKLNIEDASEVMNRYGVRNIPTLLFFKDGQVIDKIVGANPKQVIVEKINQYL